MTTTTTAASAVVCGRPLRDIDVVAAAARRPLPDGPETETVAASGSASTFFGLLTASGVGDDDDGGGRFWTLQDDEISAEAVRCRLTDGPEMETPAASGSASTTSGSGSDEDENASKVVLFQCGPNDEADDDGAVESTSGFQSAMISGVGDATGRAAESDASGVHLLSDNLV